MPIDATIIGAAATGIQPWVNALSTGNMNRKNRNFAVDQANTQRERALADWNTQNLYNSPKETMKRYKEAGLNPALIYGSGATASAAGPVRSSEGADWKGEAPQIPEGIIGETIKAGQQIGIQKSILQQNLRNEQKREALLDAQTIDTLASADMKTQGTKRSQFDLAIEEELKPYTLSGRRSDAHTKSNLVDNTALETKLKKQELDFKEANNPLSLEQIKKLNEKLDADIKNAGVEFKLKDYIRKLNDDGLQPSDPVYWRRISKFLSTLPEWNGKIW